MGNTEQIVMRLAVDSRVTDAAWIFPTPTVATVKLGDRGWFAQIDALTAPAVRVNRDWWPRWKNLRGGDGAGAPGGGPVRLLGEQQLGPFVVATLDATDAGALSAWLSSNGYHLSEDLGRTLEVYVKQSWKYVAVKLAPQAKTILHGELDPLHLSFDSTRLVYPMYISHLAKTPQYVHLWVVAPHQVVRVDPDESRIPAQLRFAGPASGVSGSLGAFIGANQWLTEYNAQISQPAEITADWSFVYRSVDTPHREVDVRYDPIYILGMPGGWFLIGLLVAGLTVLLATIGVVVVSRRGNAVPRISQ